MTSFVAWWLQADSIYGAVFLILLVLLVTAFVNFLSKRD
jgi:regulatory protein YycI of two-component signal transduction system YycFG